MPDLWQPEEREKKNSNLIQTESLKIVIPIIITKIRKGQVKNMKKTMNTVQAGREMQERSFKRMMAYQKKAEQAVNKKRMNQHMIRRG